MAVMWRRLLVLLIGGVIAVPYIAVIIWVVTAWNRLADRPTALGVVAVGIIVFALLCIPGFLAVIRALERTLAGQLLELVIPTPPRRPRTTDRIRGALFYFGHAFAGALLLFTVIVMIPSAIVFAVDPGQMSVVSLGLPTTAVQILAPAILLLLVAMVIAEGYFLPHYAQILLGPSAADRAALAGTERARRFRRTVLAREVHDSIGHALTVTTMQAAVAKRALHTDPALAEAAVDEIAATGREAVAELDHVLALLRAEADSTESESGAAGEGAAVVEGVTGDAGTAGIATGEEVSDRAWEGQPDGQRPPQRTMHDVERLAEEARSLGHPTALTVTGDVAALPDVVVGELHRIVREAVTNSLRHASVAGLSVAICAGSDVVRVETRNASSATWPAHAVGVGGRAATRDPGADTDARARESRGLRGIGERAELFGGHASWGVEDGQWILRVTLPFGEEARRWASV